MDRWIGRPASLAVRKPDGSPAAALIACPDGLGVAWLHLFAADAASGLSGYWGRLWEAAAGTLEALGPPAVWAMTTLPWLTGLLRAAGFMESGRVIAFTRSVARNIPENTPSGNLRPMDAGDLPQIEELDHAAFADPWRMDREALQATFQRSVLALVYCNGKRIGGYALAAHTPHGVHITRLAVHPADQGQGIGRGLVVRLLHELALRGTPQVSVNTQIENVRSQRLYRSLGFVGPGESYPVFRYALPRSAQVRDADPE